MCLLLPQASVTSKTCEYLAKPSGRGGQRLSADLQVKYSPTAMPMGPELQIFLSGHNGLFSVVGGGIKQEIRLQGDEMKTEHCHLTGRDFYLNCCIK